MSSFNLLIEQQEKLARRLLYLPIDLHEKVLLWLAYRGIKPVSEITVERRDLPLFRRLLRQGKKINSTYNDNDSRIKRVKKWICDAGLFYDFDPEYPSSWHVSYDKYKAQLSVKILRKFDYQNEYLSGILFGFPESSARAYAHNRVANAENQIPMKPPFTNSPYEFFAIPTDKLSEGIQAATVKVWADTIRQDVPKLAEWSEKVKKS